ncbi:uncharacterized protein BO80DRAFT_428261, partial [Aspergillus ibericus CBS 121593]
MKALHNANQRAISLASDICFSVPCMGAQGKLPCMISSVHSSTLLFHLHVAKEMVSGPAESRLSILERLQYLREKQPSSQHKSWYGLQVAPQGGPDLWEGWQLCTLRHQTRPKLLQCECVHARGPRKPGEDAERLFSGVSLVHRSCRHRRGHYILPSWLQEPIFGAIV